MSAAVHTPGPWRAVHDSVKVGRFNVCPLVTAGGSAKGMIDEREVVAANARLIAAAPELLAALESALKLIQGEIADGGYTEEAKQAADAIAKATGVAQ